MTKIMKTLSRITVAIAVLWCTDAGAQATRLSDVINESINFLKAPAAANTARSVSFSFSIDENNGVIAGVRGGVALGIPLNLETVVNKLTGEKTFLKSRTGSYKSTAVTETGQTFVAQSNSSSISNPDLIDLMTITYKTNNGTVTRTVGIRNHLSVARTSTSGSGTSIANEYVVFGLVNPASPGQVITLRIRQKIILFG